MKTYQIVNQPMKPELMTMNTEEVLVPVIGFEPYYSISNYGNILITGLGRGRRINRYLKKQKNKDGYLKTELRVNGVRYGKQVHRLVAEAFIPNPSNKPYVNHIDANPSNNHINNLEWCTQAENMQHAYKLGRMYDKRGTNNGRSKLTEIQVINIRHCKGSISQDRLAKLYGVAQSRISDIWSGKHWKHI